MTEPAVFISYSHESDAHRERVLGLSERLRDDGFDTRLDRYVNGSPPQGWARWMLDQLDASQWVLVVCTETYYRRFRGHEEPGFGRGVDFEGLLITQELYDARSINTRFVPVLFDTADTAYIPEPLRPGSWYALTSDAEYASLLAVLQGVAGVEPRPIGVPPDVDRPTGRPIRFETAPESPALNTWRRKRDMLIVELAKATGEAKFGIQESLAEAEAMIVRLEGGGG